MCFFDNVSDVQTSARWDITEMIDDSGLLVAERNGLDIAIASRPLENLFGNDPGAIGVQASDRNSLAIP